MRFSTRVAKKNACGAGVRAAGLPEASEMSGFGVIS